MDRKHSILVCFIFSYDFAIDTSLLQVQRLEPGEEIMPLGKIVREKVRLLSRYGSPGIYKLGNY